MENNKNKITVTTNQCGKTCKQKNDCVVNVENLLADFGFKKPGVMNRWESRGAELEYIFFLYSVCQPIHLQSKPLMIKPC